MSTVVCTDLIPVTIEHEGAPWALWRQSADSKEPLAKDTDVAVWLGYDRPRDIRQLIDRYTDDLGVFSRHRTAKIATDGSKRGRPEEGYLLTEAQALFIAAKSETPKANVVLKTMIAVFLKARDLLRGVLNPAMVRDMERLTPPEAAAELGVNRTTTLRWMWMGGHVGARKLPRGEWHQLAERFGVGRSQRQQELKLQGEPAPALEERALAVLQRHPAGLEAAHMAQVLGAPVPQMTAVLGGMVEAGDLHVAARAGRLLYQPAPTPEPMTDLQQQVKGFMEARPGNERVATREIIEGLGLEHSKTNEVRVGLALRSLGYERIRHHDGSGWRRYAYVKPEDKN